MPTRPTAKRPPWMPAREAHGRRVNPNADVYNAYNYRKRVRLHKIANPLCVHCLARGIRTPVEVTDHIKPINQGGAVDDPNNWQSLCTTCHNIKSGQEAHSSKAGGGLHP